MSERITRILTVVVFSGFMFLSLRSCVSVPTKINQDAYAITTYVTGQTDYLWIASANKILVPV